MDVIPGQCQVSYNQLAVLTMPEWAIACAVYIMWLLSAGWHTANHRVLPCGATLASRTSTRQRHGKSFIPCNFLILALLDSGCLAITPILSCRALYMTATGPVTLACYLASSASDRVVCVPIFAVFGCGGSIGWSPFLAIFKTDKRVSSAYRSSSCGVDPQSRLFHCLQFSQDCLFSPSAPCRQFWLIRWLDKVFYMQWIWKLWLLHLLLLCFFLRFEITSILCECGE